MIKNVQQLQDEIQRLQTKIDKNPHHAFVDCWTAMRSALFWAVGEISLEPSEWEVQLKLDP